YVKSFPMLLLAAKLPFLIAGTVRRIYYATRFGLGKPAIQGFFEGLGLIPRMIRKRQDVQRRRKVSIAYIKSLMTRKP
ncbi:MAG: hypothetical protein AAB393_06385, partial [Bacteroidota bacterium]